MSPEEKIQTILAATDFSETGDAAVAWAAELATAHRARLLLCHALAPAMPTAPAPEFVPLPARFYDDMREAAEGRLARAAAELRARGLAVDVALDPGVSAEAVVREAVRSGADLVVVGTRGLTGWKRVALGSTAARVVRHAPCPVLTVHPEDAGRHRPVRTVLVPTDFSADAALASEAAARLLGKERAARIVLLHAYHVPAEYAAPLPVPIVLEDVEQVEAAARIDMAEIAAAVRARGIAVDVKVVEGYPPQAIVDEARDAGADLIAMGTHGRSGLKRLFLGSTAERVLASAPCPVLTVHRADSA
ncbi:MAG TPA: universal stress protein [Candidatus Binatia bacterium]|nr:universal stress protein [Candidatus Binatia bacterium]